MKRALAIILSVLLFAGNFAPVFAQASYEELYTNYINTLDIYQKAHSEYQIAKNGYIKNPTIAAQAQAIEKTKTMLELRDETLITYLRALKQKLADTQGVATNDLNNFSAQIDLELAWLSTHKNSISSAGSLSDLVDDSDEAADRYSETTEVVIYNTLNSVSLGKVVSFRNRERDVVGEIKDFLLIVKGNGDKDVSLIERWLIEIDDRFIRSNDKEVESSNLAAAITSKSRDKLKEFNTAQTKAEEARQYLKEASFFLGEIVNNIKTAD